MGLLAATVCGARKSLLTPCLRYPTHCFDILCSWLLWNSAGGSKTPDGLSRLGWNRENLRRFPQQGGFGRFGRIVLSHFIVYPTLIPSSLTALELHPRFLEKKNYLDLVWANICSIIA